MVEDFTWNELELVVGDAMIREGAFSHLKPSAWEFRLVVGCWFLGGVARAVRCWESMEILWRIWDACFLFFLKRSEDDEVNICKLPSVRIFRSKSVAWIFFRLLKNTEKPFLYYLGLFDGDLMWCTIVTKVLTQCWRFGCHLRRLQQGLLADLWSIASWAGGWRKWRITGNQQGGSRWLLCLLIKHVSKFCPKMDRNHENEWFHVEKEHFLQRTLYSCWLLLLFLQALYTFDFLATEACISQTCA